MPLKDEHSAQQIIINTYSKKKRNHLERLHLDQADELKAFNVVFVVLSGVTQQAVEGSVASKVGCR